jgi:transposase-like protein
MTSTPRPAMRPECAQWHPAQEGADREQRPGRHRHPRDRDGSFESQIVKKRRRRLSAVATAYKRGLLS